MKEPFWSKIRRHVWLAVEAVSRRVRAWRERLADYCLVAIMGPEIAAQIREDRDDRWPDRL